MDIYKEITDRIIAQMENGIIPWRKTWTGSSRAISYTTGKPYSLLNQMLLGRAGEYATFKQIQAAGGYVRKGEKASMVVFWKMMEQEDESTGKKKTVPLLRYYNVFHIDQCENITAKHTAPLPEDMLVWNTAKACAALLLSSSTLFSSARMLMGSFVIFVKSFLTLPMMTALLPNLSLPPP